MVKTKTRSVGFGLALIACGMAEAGNADAQPDAPSLPSDQGIAVRAVVYGQSIEAPLPSVGRSVDFLDWYGEGRLDCLTLLHPRYTAIKVESGWSKLVLIRNIGRAGRPLFASVEQHRVVLHHPQLGRHFALMDYDGDGKKEIASIQDNRLRLFIPGADPFTPNWTVREPTLTDSPDANLALDALEGSPTIGRMDWDGDGDDDLLLGVNHDTIMKRGFGVDAAKSAPFAARVYLLRNVSDGAVPRFEKPVVIKADGQPIQCFGGAYPVSFDINHDGLPDLIIGEHRPGIRVFMNEGSLEEPRFVSSGTMEAASPGLEPTALAHQVRPADLDGDGRDELITTSYFGAPSLLQWYRQDKYAHGIGGWTSRGFLPMQTHPNTPLVGPGISTPDPVDWDGDGDTDLLLGAEPGTPMIALNIGTEASKVFAAPRRLRFIDGSLLETYSAGLGDGSHHGPKEWFDDRFTPRAVDWDRDGILDIVSGTQGRRLYWLRGLLVEGELRFEKPRVFQLEGKPLLHPHRCLPAVIDWNRDGFPDLIGLDERSDLVAYFGAGDSHLQGALPFMDTTGKPISASINIKNPGIDTSPSGRSGVAALDWDGDGVVDLITVKHYFDGRVLFHKGVDAQTFEPAVMLFDFFSHLGGPGVVDWNRDGHPDIVMGGDYRRLAGLSHQMPIEDRAHYFVYDGKTLPIPSAPTPP